MSHPIRLFFEILGTLAALLLVGAGLLLWRLSAGPIAVPFVTPILEAALAADDSNFDVDVAETWLDWSGLNQSMELRIVGTVVRDRQGKELVSIPLAWLRLSARRLLVGEVQPEAVRIEGLHLRLARDANGDIRLQESDANDAPVAEGGVLGFLLGELSGPPDPDKMLGLLSRLTLTGTRIDVEDALTGLSVSLVGAQAEAARDDRGIALSASLPLQVGAQRIPVTVRARYVVQNEEIRLAADIPGVWLPGLADLDPRLALLKGLRLRPDIGLDAVVSAGRIEQGRLTLRARDAVLADPAWFAREVAVREMALEANVSADFAKIAIEKFEIDLGTPTIRVTGTADDLLRKPAIKLRADILGLDAKRLVELWPHAAPENPKIWIADSLAQARVPAGVAELEMSAKDASFAGFALDKFRLTFDVRDATVEFLKGLPPVRNASASAVMDTRRLDFKIASGEVGEIKVRGGTVSLTGLDKADQAAQINLDMTTPVRAAMRLIDMPPLGFLKRIGEDPEGYDGNGTVKLAIAFPLEANLKLDQVKVRAEARATEFFARNAVKDQPIEHGDFNIVVDENGMDLKGLGLAGGSPAEIAYRREFSDKADPVERATAKGTASPETQARFNLDFPAYLDGPIDVDVAMVAYRDGRRLIDLGLDLANTTVKAPELDWSRAPGKKLNAKMRLVLRRDTLVELQGIDAAGEGIAVRGRVGFDADGRTIREVDLDRALLDGRMDLDNLRVRRDPKAADGRGSDRYEAKGKFLDVEPFLKDKTPPDPKRADFGLRGAFERLKLGAGRELRAASIDGQRGQRLWERLRLSAQLDPSTPPAAASAAANNAPAAGAQAAAVPFQFELDPDADGMQRLTANSPDAGAVLKALDITPNMVGGRLVARGKTDPARPDQAIAGTLAIENFRLVNAPVMAKLLSVALLTGVLDSLRGEGIGFSRLDTDFAWADPRIEIKDLRMYGASIGFTANGVVDLEADQIDIAGTIVPAYAVNSILGNIPLLGDLLAGQRGGGIFAANYTAKGPASDADVRINPLSTLAPGFLRRLFGIFGGANAPAPATGANENAPPAPPIDPLDPRGGQPGRD
jgi:hypothetical protein